jgi:hypothetical protein
VDRREHCQPNAGVLELNQAQSRIFAKRMTETRKPTAALQEGSRLLKVLIKPYGR